MGIKRDGTKGAWGAKKGFIYFLRARGYSSGIKIGFSTKPEHRMEHLKSEAGVPLILDGYVPGTRKHEKAVHAILHHARLHGEWFYTRDRRVSGFISDILIAGKFPKDFIKLAPDLHADVGGTSGICPCGRVRKSAPATRFLRP